MVRKNRGVKEKRDKASRQIVRTRAARTKCTEYAPEYAPLYAPRRGARSHSRSRARLAHKNHQPLTLALEKSEVKYISA